MYNYSLQMDYCLNKLEQLDKNIDKVERDKDKDIKLLWDKICGIDSCINLLLAKFEKEKIMSSEEAYDFRKIMNNYK